MGRIVWACWDGGGNLTPSFGIARVLEERGHEVHFFGRPEMVCRVEAAGFAATALANALEAFDGDPATSWQHVVHGAPVLTAERRAIPVELP